MRRLWWLGFGVGAHALFALTVFRLVPFLQGESPGMGLWSKAPTSAWLAIDALLALQFAVFHSLLLLPATRQWFERWVPSPLYGCLFCVLTCISLLTTIETWQPCPSAVWRLHGVARFGMNSAFGFAWVGLFYSLHLTGLGYQTGWTPWWAWARRRALPRRTFEPCGAYRWLRHPIYLSFLGLVWLTPAMTYDRVVLTAIWTTYIFVGSVLKDRRLIYYLGDPYRRYQSQVAGYPFFPLGPLAKIPTQSLSKERTNPLPSVRQSAAA